jgi:general secretion pathway protein J
MMRYGAPRSATIQDRRRRRAAVAGFTLIEALVATALMGLVLAALATITAQWLPNWNRGIARVQRTELVSLSLNRLIADIEAAEFITPSRDSKLPLFEGTESSVILVRSALGPDPRPGLEIVRLAEAPDRLGIVLVRSTTPFAPFEPQTVSFDRLKFANPVALLHAPYRVSFAYAGRDGIWKNAWQNSQQLPAAVRLTVLDAATRQTLSISTTAVVHVELPAACVDAKSKADCTVQPAGQNGAPAEKPEQGTPPMQRGDLPTQRSVL